MELRFLKQATLDAITVLDEIELVNCDPDTGIQNGPYTVGRIDDNADVTLVGTGPLSGYITVINLDQGEQE